MRRHLYSEDQQREKIDSRRAKKHKNALKIHRDCLAAKENIPDDLIYNFLTEYMLLEDDEQTEEDNVSQGLESVNSTVNNEDRK